MLRELLLFVGVAEELLFAGGFFGGSLGCGGGFLRGGKGFLLLGHGGVGRLLRGDELVVFGLERGGLVGHCFGGGGFLSALGFECCHRLLRRGELLGGSGSRGGQFRASLLEGRLLGDGAIEFRLGGSSLGGSGFGGHLLGSELLI